MIESFLLMLLLLGLGISLSNEMFFMTISFSEYQVYLSVFTFAGLIVAVMWIWTLILLPFKWVKHFFNWRQKSKEKQKILFLIRVLEALVNHTKEQYHLLVKQARTHFSDEEESYWLILDLLHPSEEVYQKLLRFPTTNLGGIYGFLNNAMEFGNTIEMHHLLDSLPEKERKVLWVRQAYLQLAYMEADWQQALLYLEQLKKNFSKTEYKRQLACCLMMTGQIDKAYKLDETQAQIVLAYAQENPEKAMKVLKKAWKIAPCWEIYQAFKRGLLSKSDSEKMKEIIKLTKVNRGNRFSILALADMNLGIKNFSKTKEILDEYLESHPLTQQVALMMAEAERAEGNQDIAQKWEQKALDIQERTGWTCTHCGRTTSKWEAVCSSCHLFNMIKPD